MLLGNQKEQCRERERTVYSVLQLVLIKEHKLVFVSRHVARNIMDVEKKIKS